MAINLETINNKILELDNRLIELNSQIELIQENMKEIELITLKGIFLEVGDNGKRKFSNEDLRRIELMERLNRNEKYQKLKGELKELKLKEATTKANKGFLLRRLNYLVELKSEVI